ncbi:MAG TPA: cupin domain-containing protein [bacterium]|nr:cupin domain-containing protein [bacterium]
MKRDWAARGFSCGLWTDPPGAVWEDYVHPTDELVMLLEGQVELEMKGRRIRLEKEKEVLIPAGTVHSVRNRGTGTSYWLYGYHR